ncbi:MAG: 2-C-methyl-D-erythritol 2,4-cyclodiphosphate synthase [Chloroflexota bacterium]|nr:2-C-methyl-D-erythritol 2,4-cyclodiphosphate synthase [Chloroflexota bacterium]
MRVGIGYDIHKFQEGRRLILGGVEIAGETGLAGHSDADVLLHAIMDALLGAASLGDIGHFFPPDDPTYARADSRRLLAQTVQMIAQVGYSVENVDATVIAERPRLGPHIAQMRQRIAQTLALEESKVSVKATTNEGVGDIGRGLAIAALAIALLKER